ncbi:tetratricopeptide repeat protein [Kitasatospora sp. NPDC004669]|uniref:tetratricopeptide repeat protein n=1 Tax=Kitasatospora sp. NPDC004669 TaxID=3154555 RepID=UPI0033B2A643
MQFSVLGRLSVHDGSGKLTLSGTKLRSLLAVLLLHANRPIATDRLQDVLWSENPPTSGAAAVHNLVARLRRALSDDAGQRLSVTPLGYLLKVADGELDCQVFKHRLARAQAAFMDQDWDAVRRETAAALELWQGDPLAELADLDEARAPREHWREARLQALEWNFDAQLNLGRHQGISADLAALTAEHPFREAFHRQLMVALHRTDRTAEALEVYRALRSALVDELGIDPSRATQEVHQEILSSGGTSGSLSVPTPRPTRDTPSGTASVVSASLPRDISSFVGRHEEIDLVLATCRAGAATGGVVGIHAVDGMPGVGKSAFAVHCAHRLAADFPDGQIFMPLHAHTPGTPAIEPTDALATLLLATGVTPQQIPSDLSARAGLWRTQVAGKKMLVLFDDARSSEQLKPLLPGTSGTLVIVTSRRRLVDLEDTVPITLNVLPPQDAARLFTAKAGRAGLLPEDPSVVETVRLCGYLPLAIQLTAARLRHHPSWSVADLISDLTAATGRLATLHAESTSAAAAFDLSYRYLSSDLQRLFQRLGLHPGNDFDAYTAAALDDTDLPTARRLLEVLEDHHLIDEPVRGRYRMHDLIREHARALADANEPAANEAAMERLLDYYLAAATAANRPLARHTPVPAPVPTAGPATPNTVPDLSTVALANAWLKAERANLQAAVEFAAAHGRSAHAVRLPAAMHEGLRSQGHWQQARSLHQIAFDTALRTGDRQGQADALTNRGIMWQLSGQLEPSAKDLLRAVELYDELGDRHGRANALTSIGHTRHLAGHLTEAVECHQEALVGYRDLGDRLGEANTLISLGHVLMLTGRWTEVGEHLQSSLELCRALGNRLGEANALYCLGMIRELTGPFEVAVANHREALELYSVLGNRLGQANAFSGQGNAERLTGDFEAAESSHLKALELHRAIGSRQGQANTLNFLALLQRDTGRYADAVENIRAAREMYSAGGDRRGEMISLAHLGCIEQRTGQHEPAADTLREAVRSFQEQGFALGEARALAHLGDAQLSLGEYEAAAESLRLSLTMCREVQDSGSEAESLNLLGKLLSQTGRWAEARTHHTKALEIARAITYPLQETRALEGIGDSLCREGSAREGEAHLRQALTIAQRLGAPDVERILASLRAVHA